MSPKAAAVFAAGPIEDLLAFDGARFIERVEELARKDPRFNWLPGDMAQCYDRRRLATCPIDPQSRLVTGGTQQLVGLALPKRFLR